MTQQLELARMVDTDSRLAAEMMVDIIPTDGSLHQPIYPNRADLVEAVHELTQTTPPTTFENIRAHREKMIALATGTISVPRIERGPCSEPLGSVGEPIEVAVHRDLKQRDITLDVLGEESVDISRSNQGTKPRSNATEVVEGVTMETYKGDWINSLTADPRLRLPDPRRLVAGNLQTRDILEMRREILGMHSPTGHEALSLAMTLAMLRLDPDTGELGLTSGDEPWGGARTNDPEDLTMQVLSGLINTIGVKLRVGDEHKIADLESLLNPLREPGKVVYNVRVGNDLAAMHAIARVIRDRAPESLVVYDGHGSTTVVKAPSGKDVKVRHIPTLIDDTKLLAEVLDEHGLKLHGAHVETTWDPSRLECTDELGQLPTHPGNVDPGMNPRQYRTYLKGVKAHLPN